MSMKQRHYYTLEHLPEAITDQQVDVLSSIMQNMDEVAKADTEASSDAIAQFSKALKELGNQLAPQERAELLCEMIGRPLDLLDYLSQGLSIIRDADNNTLKGEMQGIEYLRQAVKDGQLRSTELFEPQRNFWQRFPETLLIAKIDRTNSHIMETTESILSASDQLFAYAQKQSELCNMVGKAKKHVLSYDPDSFPPPETLINQVINMIDHINTTLDDIAKLNQHPTAEDCEAHLDTLMTAAQNVPIMAVIPDEEDGVTLLDQPHPVKLRPDTEALLPIMRVMLRQSRSAANDLKDHLVECYQTLGIDVPGQGKGRG